MTDRGAQPGTEAEWIRDNWRAEARRIASMFPHGQVAVMLAEIERLEAEAHRQGREALREAALRVYHGRIGYENHHDPDILALGAVLFPDRAALAADPRPEP